MDIKSQFAGRYKTDLSVDNLRAKVAKRKSISQKENRHKEFRKSRGLALIDANVSVVKEQELGVLEEVTETFHAKGSINKIAVPVNNAEKISTGRLAMLQRYKEEKQLRKLKEQREKATKVVFRCGIYKPETIPVFTSKIAAPPKAAATSQNATKVKPKEKPAPPPVTRVTRSAARIEAPVLNTRSRPAQVPVFNKTSDRAIPNRRGPVSVLKANEKENKVPAIPPVRTTRATAAATSRLPAAKGAVKNTSVVAKPQKRTKEISKQETALTKPEPAGLGHEQTDKVTPEVPMEDKVTLEVSMEDKVTPEVSMEDKVTPEVPIEVTAVESEMPAKTETSVREERKPSFAPENFVFQPMDGLSTFKFQPMTPKRANAFLTPTFTWSPVNGKSNFVFTRGYQTEENKSPQVSPPDLSLKTMNDELEMDTCDSPEATGDVCTTLAVRGETPPACTPTDYPVHSDETQHDVPYFRDLLKSEIQRLTLLCSEWDTRIEQDIPEDAKDLIRTTVGQTRLLLTERFKQFEGLVDNCEFKRGDKETTCTDLDGFWDMIYFQIEDVSKKFVNLEKLEENSWQQTTVKAKKVVRKKSVPAPPVAKSQGDNGRAAARSRLAAIKAAMRNGVKQKEMVEEASVSEQTMQVDPVVFDAGFFRIESPAKLPSSRRKTESCSQTSDTPKSTNDLLQTSHIDTEKGEDHILQNADNPVGVNPEGGAGHVHVQKSPSPAKSPVRKALFDTEESLQNHQEDPPLVISSENTESEIVPQVDLTKYLVPTSENVADSPGFVECFRLETGGTELEEDTKFEVEGTMVDDDVFMCSPEKVQETTSPSHKDETIDILPYEDVANRDNPLDFLGDSASDVVPCTPVKADSAALISDLMVFSPMEF